MLLHAGNYAVFNVSGTVEKRLIESMLGHTPLHWDVTALHRGEAILKTASNPVPVLVRVSPPRPGVPKLVKILMDSLRDRPCLTQRERRASLGLDGKTYSRIVAILIEKGVAELVEVFTGGPGRPPKILALKGKVPGALHHYGVKRASEEASRVCKVVPAGDGRADIAVLCGEARIAIEVETGTNVVREKYARLLKEYDAIVIVCVRKSCMRQARKTANAFQGRVVVSTLHSLATTLRGLARRP